MRGIHNDEGFRMTKRHFKIMAKLIDDSNMAPAEKLTFAEGMANELAKRNPRFDKVKFLNAACVIRV